MRDRRHRHRHRRLSLPLSEPDATAPAGTERMTFALMAANRLTTRWVPLVSSLNQFAPVTVTADEEAHPLECLRACYVQSMTA